MGRRERERCLGYRQELERAKNRLAEIEEKGAEALSAYDRKVAFQGDDERAIQISTMLVTNHVRYFAQKLEGCPRGMFDVPEATPTPRTRTAEPKGPRPEPIARQATLFELADDYAPD